MDRLTTKLFQYIHKRGCSLDVFVKTILIRKPLLFRSRMSTIVLQKQNTLCFVPGKKRFIFKNSRQFCQLLQCSDVGKCVKQFQNVFFHLVDLRYMFEHKLNLFVVLNLLQIDLSTQASWFTFNARTLKAVLTYMLYTKEEKGQTVLFQEGQSILRRIGGVCDRLRKRNKDLQYRTYTFQKFLTQYRRVTATYSKALQ